MYSQNALHRLSPLPQVYRGGYSPAERRSIEAELFSGRLIGVAATNALELGVDVGSLDVTLHLGFQVGGGRPQLGCCCEPPDLKIHNLAMAEGGHRGTFVHPSFLATCPSVFRDPSPQCGSRPGGPGGVSRSPWQSTWHLKGRWISTSCATLKICLVGP